MKLNGFIKRVFFFLAAFAVGVTMTGLLFGFQTPRFVHRHREGKRQHIQQIKAENERLRMENLELKQQLGSVHAVEAVPPTPPPPPPPAVKLPAAPHNHK